MVEAFELMGRLGVSLAVRRVPGVREPLAAAHPWYVLVETAAAEAGGAEAALERILVEALARGLVADASVAQNAAQAQAFWRLREAQSAAQKPEGAAWKHDIAVPVGEVPAFIAQASAAAEALLPGARVVAFGHVGDGNIHFDVLPPEGGDAAVHGALRQAAAARIHDVATGLGGSISAEHGLGVMKAAEALRYKDPAEIAAMRAIRAALDPQRIMNPRALF
jgi:FAD/FMN-containing dehydrogenase